MSLTLMDVDTGPFRYLPYLLVPVLALVAVAIAVYLVRHRQDRRSR